MNRLKALRINMGCSQKDVASFINKTFQAYSLYEQGKREPDNETLQKLADYFNVSVDYLLGRDNKPSKPKKQAHRINVYGSIPAGVPLEAVEDIEDWEEIPIEMTEGGKEYIALRVSGDSMWPEYLDNDVVIIQLQPDCENGDDCAVYVNGYDATLKRIKKEKGKITLQPLNSNYAPATYTHPGEVQILGKVIELRRKKSVKK